MSDRIEKEKKNKKPTTEINEVYMWLNLINETFGTESNTK